MLVVMTFSEPRAANEECSTTAQCSSQGMTCRSDDLGATRCLCAPSGEVYDSTLDKCLTGNVCQFLGIRKSSNIDN